MKPYCARGTEYLKSLQVSPGILHKVVVKSSQRGFNPNIGDTIKLQTKLNAYTVREGKKKLIGLLRKMKVGSETNFLCSQTSK